MNDAVSEARRCAEQLGFRAVFLRANPLVDHQWQGDYYEPLWSALEDLNISVGFHESTGTGRNQVGERLEPNFMLRRVYAQPIEQMMALGCFCAGGVLARHPKLRVAFLEANCSWLPWLLWRLDEAWELEGDVWANDVKEKPSEYFNRQCVVSIEPDEIMANNILEQVGNGNLVFSTDYPHGDSRYPEAINHFSDCRSPTRTNEKSSGTTARATTRCKVWIDATKSRPKKSRDFTAEKQGVRRIRNGSKLFSLRLQRLCGELSENVQKDIEPWLIQKTLRSVSRFSKA